MSANANRIFWQELYRAVMNLAAAAKSIGGVIRKHKLDDEENKEYPISTCEQGKP